MPAANLSVAAWAALRAKWEVEGFSNRTLAAEFEIDEGTIRYRAKKERWERKPEALEAIQRRAQEKTLDRAFREAFPHSAESAENPEAAEDAQGLRPADRSELQQKVIDGAADVIAEANLRALAKCDKLDLTFEQLAALVNDLLSRPTDEGSAARKREAVNTLLPGKSDTVVGSIMALHKLAESIQAQRRKALGADDRPKQVQLTGANGGPIESSSTTTAVQRVDFAAMSTEDLAKLWSAAELLDGRRERPPVPVPPGSPSHEGGGAADAG